MAHALYCRRCKKFFLSLKQYNKHMSEYHPGPLFR